MGKRHAHPNPYGWTHAVKPVSPEKDSAEHSAGDSWTEHYRDESLDVKISYSPAPSTCSKEKIDNDDGCEFFDVSAKVTITPQNGKSVTYSGFGSCGC
jgi:hypothetical protein